MPRATYGDEEIKRLADNLVGVWIDRDMPPAVRSLRGRREMTEYASELRTIVAIPEIPPVKRRAAEKYAEMIERVIADYDARNPA